MASDSPLMSSVDLWPLNWAPVNWAACNGQLMSIAQNSALFALLGTTYGGDGMQTFALPDLRGRVPVGFGQGPGLSNYSLGQVSGTENVTLLVSQLPSHSHAASGTVTPSAATGGRGASTSTDPTGNYPGTAPSGTAIYGTPATVQMGSSPVTVTVQPVGNGQPVSILQPYLALNYIIAINGIFPSRP